MISIWAVVVILIIIGMMAVLIMIVGAILRMEGFTPEDVMLSFRPPVKKVSLPPSEPQIRQVKSKMRTPRSPFKRPAATSASAYARLMVEAGYEQGSWININTSPFNIGRHSTCSFSIPDPTVSRFHAEIFFDGTYYILVDANSINGTLLNGHEITKMQLYHGDEISIGGTTLVFFDREH